MGLFRRKREPFLTASPDAPVPGMSDLHETAVQAVPAPSDVTVTSTVPAEPGAAPAPAAPFSFTVADAFSITGRGTVVTGTVDAGTVHRDDRVDLVRDGEVYRAGVVVAGIETKRKRVDEASGGAVGLLLKDVARDAVQRGDVIRAAV